jgi:predicted regulator of Ras-like GTPase activity (Roadblock/LC7/MglB family)
MSEGRISGTESNAGGAPSGALERALGDLRALSEDIESCSVLSPTGDLQYSSHGPGVERARVAAMLGALVGLARRSARKEGKDLASQVRVRTEAGHLLMVGLEGGGTLVATTAPEARVGLVLYDMRNARVEIKKATGEVG